MKSKKFKRHVIRSLLENQEVIKKFLEKEFESQVGEILINSSIREDIIKLTPFLLLDG